MPNDPNIRKNVVMSMMMNVHLDTFAIIMCTSRSNHLLRLLQRSQPRLNQAK
ncbi:unnamed protein product [Meloidogyne enterolobii]|uniref:Uncharacterized protein n=1 Tax=Meloidogyne enterolobii TaxID=390850 RepID=A0ACB0XK86_MELEN